MKTLLSTIFLLFAYPLHGGAQALIIDSTRFITGNNPEVDISYAIPTADKGILFVGSDFGNPGGIIPYFFDTSINGNVMVGKIDSNQKISWIKIYGGSQEDGGGPACQTPDGGFAVLAGTSSNDGDVTGFLGAVDIWLIRIDDTGKLLWEKCYGSSQSDGPISIANTPDHGFIILGSTNGSDDNVPFHYGGFFSTDWLVIKTDSVGNLQWSKDLGGTGDEGESGSILSVDSSYYLISWSDSHDHDCTDTAWHSGLTFNNGNYYVLKLNDTGKVLWDSSYGGSGGDDAYYAMFDTRDSSIVVNGLTHSKDYMITDYNGGDADMWVVKVNKNGTMLWAKALGGPNDDEGTGICADHHNGYIVYGSTFEGPIGLEDCWLFALGNTGNEISNKIFGGISYENPRSILPYLNGYVATGFSASNVFTEGSTYGNFDSGGGFISYIDTGTLSVKNIIKGNNQLVLYPNPVQEEIKIILSGNETGNLSIMNALGQIVYMEDIKNQKTYLNINANKWGTGLYLVKWQDESGNIQTAKFIKM